MCISSIYSSSLIKTLKYFPSFRLTCGSDLTASYGPEASGLYLSFLSSSLTIFSLVLPSRREISKVTKLATPSYNSTFCFESISHLGAFALIAY